MPPKRDNRCFNFFGTLWLRIPKADFCTWTLPANTNHFYERYIYEHEIATDPAAGRTGDHIQFFCTTKKRWTYAQLTKALGLQPNEVHFEAARDAAASWDYCGKDKPDQTTRCKHCEPRQFGSRPAERGGGQRKRFESELRYRGLLGLIDAGQSFEQLLRGPLGGYVFQRASAVQKIQSSLQAPRNTPDEWSFRSVIVFFGDAGTGKSRAVREECARFGHSLWVAPIGFTGVWFDCYDNHTAVLIDDFRGEMSFASMLNLLEGNKVLVPIKGGYAPFAPKLVYFTSDRHYREWWFAGRDGRPAPQSPEDEAQLARRITYVREFRKPPSSVNDVLGTGCQPEDLSWDEDIFQEINLLVGGGGNTESPPPTSNILADYNREYIFDPDVFFADSE